MLVVLERVMLAVDLGMTHVTVGAIALGSAVHWLLYMLSQKGKASTCKARNPAQQSSRQLPGQER